MLLLYGIVLISCFHYIRDIRLCKLIILTKLKGKNHAFLPIAPALLPGGILENDFISHLQFLAHCTLRLQQIYQHRSCLHPAGLIEEMDR